MKSMGVFEGLMEAFSYIVRMFSGLCLQRAQEECPFDRRHISIYLSVF
jgi:hypothetical protein